MNNKFQCGKCGSYNLRVYEDNSGFCLNCNDTFADINIRQGSKIVKEVSTEPALFRYEFNYEMTKKDNEMAIVSYQKIKDPNMKKMIVLFLIIAIILLVVIILLPVQISNSELLLYISYPVILLGILIDLPIKFLMWHKPEDYLINQPVNLIFDNSKIVFITNKAELKFTWKAVEYVTKEADGICMIISPKLALFIPRRVFQTNEEFDSLSLKAREAQYAAWNYSWQYSFLNEKSSDEEELEKDLNFNLTINDYGKFWTYSILNYPHNKLRIVVASLVFVLSSTILIFIPMNNFLFDIISFIWLFIVIYLVLLISNVIKRVHIRLRPSFYGVGIPRKLSIGEGNIIIKLENHMGKYPWGSIHGITSNKDYMYFQIFNRRSIIIPKRVFKNKLECDAFFRKVKEIHTKSIKRLKASPGRLASRY